MGASGGDGRRGKFVLAGGGRLSSDREWAGPREQRPGSLVSRQRRRRTRLSGTADLVPDLDKGLGFRIPPGQASFFQIVGAATPQFTPLKGPTCHYAAIGQGVENRSSCPYTRRTFLVHGGRLGWTAKSGTPDRRLAFELIAISLILVPELDGQPSLDTPNARPGSDPLQGPQFTHRRHLQTSVLAKGFPRLRR